MYYLGIDGGGTETVFAMMDENGEIIKSHICDGCYYPDIGKNGFTLIKPAGTPVCGACLQARKMVQFQNTW